MIRQGVTHGRREDVDEGGQMGVQGARRRTQGELAQDAQATFALGGLAGGIARGVRSLRGDGREGEEDRKCGGGERLEEQNRRFIYRSAQPAECSSYLEFAELGNDGGSSSSRGAPGQVTDGPCCRGNQLGILTWQQHSQKIANTPL